MLERGLNAIGRPRQVEESAPVRSDFDGKLGFSESARSDRLAIPPTAMQLRTANWESRKANPL